MTGLTIAKKTGADLKSSIEVRDEVRCFAFDSDHGARRYRANLEKVRPVRSSPSYFLSIRQLYEHVLGPKHVTWTDSLFS